MRKNVLSDLSKQQIELIMAKRTIEMDEFELKVYRRVKYEEREGGLIQDNKNNIEKENIENKEEIKQKTKNYGNIIKPWMNIPKEINKEEILNRNIIVNIDGYNKIGNITEKDEDGNYEVQVKKDGVKSKISSILAYIAISYCAIIPINNPILIKG